MKRMHRGDEWPLTDEAYEKLDPGIRRLVRLLVSEHFRPTDSGDGTTKLAEYGGDLDGEILDTPHVFMAIDRPGFGIDVAGRLQHVLTKAGVDVAPGMIQLSYDPVDGSCVLSLTGVDDAMLGGDS